MTSVYPKTAQTVQNLGRAAEITRGLGGRWHGSYGTARCPCHEDRNASLSLRNGDFDLLVNCFAGCSRIDVLRALRQHGLLEGPPAGPQRQPKPLPAVLRPFPGDRIRAVWARSSALPDSLSDRYIRERDLDPGLLDNDAVRHLPAWGERPPMMVAKVTDFTDPARIVGLQFTPLNSDGTRGERTFLRGSRIGGGVIRLTPDADVTTELGIAEGLETALAVMTALHRAGRMVLPVWSALNAGNLMRLPIVPGIERLTIYADRDPSGTGQRAADALAKCWAAVGRSVFIATPKTGDWNEVAA